MSSKLYIALCSSVLELSIIIIENVTWAKDIDYDWPKFIFVGTSYSINPRVDEGNSRRQDKWNMECVDTVRLIIYVTQVTSNATMSCCGTTNWFRCMVT